MQEKTFSPFHTPVLTEEVLSFFQKEYKTVADLTIGLGGHSKLFLLENPNILLYGVDQDQQAIAISKKELPVSCFLFHNDFFSQVEQWKKEGRKFDFILADLGVSSLQLEEKNRGFSFSKNEKLDMRMNQEQFLTADEVIHSYDKEELARIFFEYGEERHSRFFARKIEQKRKEKRFETCQELAEFIQYLSFSKRKKTSQKFHLHPATRIFQAIRIEVNQELELLQKMLNSVLDVLQEKARLAIISFHSLEDRIVKKQFQHWAKPPSKQPFPLPEILEKPLVKILTKKPITPSIKEIKANLRSRSAKLRVIEKLEK